MNIAPLTSIADLNAAYGTEKVSGENTGSSFKVFFEDALKTVYENNAQSDLDSQNLAVGEIDDLATMMLNASRADISLQTFVQIRNKFLDAYNEIMRINL